MISNSVRRGSMLHKSKREYSCFNTEPCLHSEPYIHLLTNTEDIEGKKNTLNSTMGVIPAKPRLWETPEDKCPVSSTNKNLQGKF